MKKILPFIMSSFTAGACIGIAAMSYLRTGALAGCIMFAFGLMAVVFFKLMLFTGRSQYCWGRRDESCPDSISYGTLAAMLVCNIVGCAAMTLLNTGAELQISPASIVQTRLANGALLCGAKAIPCGFIMTLSVRAAASGNWWPLIFGVPTFIICGFPHCVADVFYYASTPELLWTRFPELAGIYAASVAGNYIGCNFYRFFSTDTTSSKPTVS